MEQQTLQFSQRVRKLLPGLTFHKQEDNIVPISTQQVKQIQQQLLEQLVQQLSSTQYTLYNIYRTTLCRINNNYNQFRLSIKQIKSWNVEKIQLFCNYDPNIGKLLSCTAFPKLRVINLSENNIQSLECLLKIQLLDLRKLILKKNYITNICSLRKASFSGGQSREKKKGINGLQISYNYVIQMKGIEEWQSVDFQWLGLEDNTFTPDKKNFVQLQNLSWAMRTKANDLRFNISIQSRIKVYRTLAVLKQKNKNKNE